MATVRGPLRVFLDANILFSAANSNGAVRELVSDLHADGHGLVVDDYVAAEARRNLAAKGRGGAEAYLEALLSRIEVNVPRFSGSTDVVAWLPEKDRPVLLSAIACRCQILVTGDKKHFGSGYGRSFEGVTVYSPTQVDALLWG